MPKVDKNKIESWRDLERFGFIGLTGEACGIGLRYLVDMTAPALDILNQFLSVRIEPGGNTNHSDGQIAGAMLPWDMWRPLAIYCLLREGHDVVVDVNWRTKWASANYVRGITRQEFDEKGDDWRTLYEGQMRVWTASGTARSGLANRHEMFGFASG